jgi:hypothetical protein
MCAVNRDLSGKKPFEVSKCIERGGAHGVVQPLLQSGKHRFPSQKYIDKKASFKLVCMNFERNYFSLSTLAIFRHTIHTAVCYVDLFWSMQAFAWPIHAWDRFETLVDLKDSCTSLECAVCLRRNTEKHCAMYLYTKYFNVAHICSVKYDCISASQPPAILLRWRTNALINETRVTTKSRSAFFCKRKFGQTKIPRHGSAIDRLCNGENFNTFRSTKVVQFITTAPESSVKSRIEVWLRNVERCEKITLYEVCRQTLYCVYNQGSTPGQRASLRKF